MAVHGNLGVFDRDLEDWASYCERMEQYFIANGISNADRKRAILLSVCGPATFKLIRSLIAPDKPSDKSFEQIVKAVSDHLCPKPSSILQRFYFNSCVQKESESIAQFVAELRRLAVHCEFEGTLEIMLRDRLVCGVRDPQLQKRLLAERQLTFSKALELAQAFESAESSSRDIQAVRSPSVPLPVHSVDKKGLSVPDSVSCFRCGGKHYATTCKLKSVTCNNCGKTGHILRSVVAILRVPSPAQLARRAKLLEGTLQKKKTRLHGRVRRFIRCTISQGRSSRSGIRAIA